MPLRSPARRRPALQNPLNVDRETIYTLVRDVPESNLQAGDFVMVRPGDAPLIRRVITPAVAHAVLDHLKPVSMRFQVAVGSIVVLPLPHMDHITVRALRCDLPQFHLRAGDLLMSCEGSSPVIWRWLPIPEVYGLGPAWLNVLRVCYDDEADPAPEWDAPAPTRHLALVR